MVEVNPVAALKVYRQKFKTDGDCASSLAVSKAFLSQMLNEQAPVSPRVLAKLGLKRTVVQK